MKSPNIALHPEKIWLGTYKKGFDFLGARIAPTKLLSPTQSISFRGNNVVPLYKQGSDQKRIGQHLRRWLKWAIVGGYVLSVNSVNADDFTGKFQVEVLAPPSCDINPGSKTFQLDLQLSHKYAFRPAGGTIVDRQEIVFDGSASATEYDHVNCSYTATLLSSDWEASSPPDIASFVVVRAPESVSLINGSITESMQISYIGGNRNKLTGTYRLTYRVTGTSRNTDIP